MRRSRHLITINASVRNTLKSSQKYIFLKHVKEFFKAPLIERKAQKSFGKLDPLDNSSSLDFRLRSMKFRGSLGVLHAVTTRKSPRSLQSNEIRRSYYYEKLN